MAINWNAPFAYLAGSLQAIAATGKVYEVGASKPEPYDLDAIAVTKPGAKIRAAGNRLIFKNGAVQVEKTLRDGSIRYFNLKGAISKGNR